ncbi:CPBP family intramembrane glutamic endopeptidase [Halobellus clavatus]|jgi:membrane protease YdiL (CAAX protease family)|uniref:Membrane protease YdiL, CAAX protease family n=1 Tax=Halobellus clavatus TaxID=660517 RepID=A0A1H3CQW0_9EURY|nr:type II CAAX endopeptidase family protein [Halobellus clavatus]SDX56527.1 Membrane protease YdiL, CAAX protease family [Halobellus clavatus]
MPEWATFAGFAFVVTAALLLLSHASSSILTDSGTRDLDADRSPAPAEELGEPTSDTVHRVDGETEGETITLPKSGVEFRPERVRPDPEDGQDVSDFSTASLLANVAFSQGLFALLLLVGAWYAEIPARAFGVGPLDPRAAAVGVGLGVVLYVANEAGAAVGARVGLGVGDGERLRSALAPETRRGWIVLLLVVLPVIAGFEELLFRGALVGVVAAGYGVSPWTMVVVSSAAFALGHGAQGRLGVLVTGALGAVLAAAFVVTGSLLAVIVAHYLINALEFVVHEGLGVEWTPEGA